MTNANNKSKPVDLTQRRLIKEHASQMGALGWTPGQIQGDVSPLVDPVHFYLYDPLITGNSYCATTSLEDIQSLAKEGLSNIDMSHQQLGSLVQAAGIDLLWDSASNTDRPQDVMHGNIINFLQLETGKKLLKRPPPKGKSYIFGMMYYINEKDGHVVASTARPIAGTAHSPLTPDQLIGFAMPYINIDISNHPDYLTRYPKLEHFINPLKF